MFSHATVETELEPAVETLPRKRSILIVDGDAEQVQRLSRRLQSQGYATISTAHGREALAKAESDHPCLVLVDRLLPDIDGLQVCADLADGPATCCTPVIVLSDLVHDDLVRQARAAGCAFFLGKPYDPNALLALIENALQQAGDSQW